MTRNPTPEEHGQTRPEQMSCPSCRGSGCGACDDGGSKGEVPSWLADPAVNGEEAAATWRT